MRQITRDRQAVNAWDAKLREAGHRPVWNQVAPWPAVRWAGVCNRCGGGIECGIGRAAAAGSFDIRTVQGECA